MPASRASGGSLSQSCSAEALRRKLARNQTRTRKNKSFSSQANHHKGQYNMGHVQNRVESATASSTRTSAARFVQLHSFQSLCKERPVTPRYHKTAKAQTIANAAVTK